MLKQEFAVAGAAPAPWLPDVPHGPTDALRVARARERFFGEGLRPTGLVSEAVLQSWMRCAAGDRKCSADLSFETVSSLRLDTALRRCRPLRQAAEEVLRELENLLGSTGCHVLLVDPQGLVVHASRAYTAADETLIQRVARPGVDLSEHLVGTNAPAVVLKTGRTCRIGGGEHFYEHIGTMHCAAAPIRDGYGQLAGVLNLVLERQPFAFDAEMLVHMHAAGIERRLMLLQSVEHTLVEFHFAAEGLGRPGAGLMGLDEEGHIAWCNAQARQFTGAEQRSDCEEVLGLRLPALWQFANQPYPVSVAFPNGLRLWMTVRLPLNQAAAQTVSFPFETATGAECSPPPPTLATMPASAPSLVDQERDILRRTLQECGGNISKAARRLGISRGRIYRYLAQGAGGTSGMGGAFD
jgi:transcriptional regulator of acetoin/glycerol metabolism